ncbi:MAG TPA: hypothetical protein VET87_25335 [Rubrivivax sp.]|nr:hypothetical protein [Rubrivivax sp.]
MRILRTVASIGLACLSGVASADTGLKVYGTGGYWSGAQTRLHLQAVGLDSAPLRLGSQAPVGFSGRAPMAAYLSGDYYFSKDITDTAQPRAGFRASSALLIRQPGISLSDLALSSRSAASFGVATPLSLPSLLPGLVDHSADLVTTMPYLGIGYSDYSLKSGWGFWADIGLVVQSPGSAVGVGRVLFGTQSTEDLMRELRMSPMVQLGVNYSF